MRRVRTLRATQVIILFAVVSFLSAIPGMVFGEEMILAEYKDMKGALGCAENPGTMSGDIIGINQETCTPGPLICVGCYEYFCIGLDGYATMTSDACFLLAFCFGVSNCDALCIGLLPQISF